MMHVLLDTHIFFWAVTDPDRLTVTQRDQIESSINQIYVSAISIAELMIKVSVGKLVLNFEPTQVAKDSGFELLPYCDQAALLLKDLPYIHRDPFDRMLVTQALHHQFFLMSNDALVRQYECKLL